MTSLPPLFISFRYRIRLAESYALRAWEHCGAQAFS